MQKSSNNRVVTWRRRLGITSASFGFVLFASAFFPYERYFSSDLHVQEMRQHAHMLNILWAFSFYGSVVLFLLSLFGLGWSRWAGAVLNGGAFLYSLMILGALCGPFGCS
jgi:hypothetical protein